MNVRRIILEIVLILLVRAAINSGFFAVLNAYATLRAQSSNENLVSPDLEVVFRNFVNMAKNGDPGLLLEDETSEFAKCYRQFWTLHDQVIANSGRL